MRKTKFSWLFRFNIVTVFLALILLYGSTYGWNVTRLGVSVYPKEDEGLAKIMRRHVVALSQQIGWRNASQYNNLQTAAQYIVDYFQALGLEVEFQKITVNDKTVVNIIAQKKGVTNPDKIVIVGAHYDTFLNAGADNNASGISALLELANAFSKENVGTTIRFVAFVNSESPFFGTNKMGSHLYVRRLKESAEDIKAVIILDSVGYYSSKPRSQRYPPFIGILSPGSANYIAVVGNFQSSNLVRLVESSFRQKTPLPAQGVIGFDFIRSDHISFWKEKYNTILITDTGSYRNQDYDSLTDNYSKLNYLNMAQIVKGLTTSLKVLAN